MRLGSKIVLSKELNNMLVSLGPLVSSRTCSSTRLHVLNKDGHSCGGVSFTEVWCLRMDLEPVAAAPDQLLTDTLQLTLSTLQTYSMKTKGAFSFNEALRHELPTGLLVSGCSGPGGRCDAVKCSSVWKMWYARVCSAKDSQPSCSKPQQITHGGHPAAPDSTRLRRRQTWLYCSCVRAQLRSE